MQTARLASPKGMISVLRPSANEEHETRQKPSGKYIIKASL
jgi:hypothetical protein